MLRAILIDDEPDCVELLALQLAQHCPGVEVIAQLTSPEKGLEAIRTLRPDVVFLDVEMPRMNGFALLERLEEVDFSLVFVTAYYDFAQGFRFQCPRLPAQTLNGALQKRRKPRSANALTLRHSECSVQRKKPISRSKIAAPSKSEVFVDS
jgi:two-component system LytT family response regulator